MSWIFIRSYIWLNPGWNEIIIYFFVLSLWNVEGVTDKNYIDILYTFFSRPAGGTKNVRMSIECLKQLSTPG